MSATLVGVDIGFSETKRTNAVAVLRGDQLSVDRYTVDERNTTIAALDAHLVAIDAPIVPSAFDNNLARRVERAFSRGLFQKRCKPGMSHIRGTGQSLRIHGGDATDRVRQHSIWFGPRVRPSRPAIEAFPNTFLGVLIENEEYARMPTVSRKQKFAWLYKSAIDGGAVRRLIERLGLPSVVHDRVVHETDREHRAALICLLTAAAAYRNDFTAVGHEECGYFFLPPTDAWAPWAREALEQAQRRDEQLRVIDAAAQRRP